MNRLLTLALTLTAVPALAFAATPPAAKAAAAYKAPRTALGQPDLQGVWTNATITPLSRPAKYGERAVLTPEEAAAMERATAAQVARADAPTDPNLKVSDLKNADCGADGISGFNCGYNQGWKDPGEKVVDLAGEKRTSIIISPKNGQFPAMNRTAGRGARRGGGFDGPEARGAGERCLVGFGSTSGPPMLPVMYNNNYQIVQTKDAVLIEVEMVHDVRLVRLNAKHDPSNLKTWMGDSIGWWEGDTLVVETINMRPEQGLRGPAVNPKVTEWFTRIGPKQIKYRFKVEDPDLYAEPLIGEMALNTSKGELYEYACHEGNYAMKGILEGARLAEKEGRAPDANVGREEGSN
jgi:hypothetical protein